MAQHETFVRQLYPTIGDMDLRAAWQQCDRERLACEPDRARFPETRGLIERLLGEREGFREATGCDDTAAAFHFSANWFCHKRLNARHVARWDLLTLAGEGCTNVFIPDGVDGVTIGDNRDIPLPRERFRFRDWWPSHLGLDGDGELNWCQGSVSDGILLDDEPSCSFPINPHELLPDECREDLGSIIEFMTRYNEFWGPCKQLWVDRKRRAIGVEKSNCRIGFLPADPETGAVAVTACSFVTPELQPFRDERFRLAAEKKGESLEQNIDWQFVHGADTRQHRLTELAVAEARRGATIWGALGVVADHAAPYPARVCLAGEKIFPEREPLANWSVTQHAAVLTGPKRRVLYRSVEDTAHPRPVYAHPPRLRLGAGVAMQPEWQAEVESGRCVLATVSPTREPMQPA
jgi:hypothetical protein